MANIEVIPVNKDDTVQGLIEKIRETSAPQVVLFSDTRLPFLRNEINLRLLKFYSEEEGKILTLVIKDRAVKKIARSLGIRIDDHLQQRERPVTRIPATGHTPFPAGMRIDDPLQQPERPAPAPAPGYEPFPAGFDGPVRDAASAEESPPPRPPYSSSPGGKLAVALLVTFFTVLAGLWFLLGAPP